MASAYHVPLCLSCSSLMANEPSVSLSHQRIQTHLPNSFLTGSRPVDACRNLYHLNGSFLSVGVKRRITDLSSISGKFSCSLANGRKRKMIEIEDEEEDWEDADTIDYKGLQKVIQYIPLNNHKVMIVGFISQRKPYKEESELTVGNNEDVDIELVRTLK